MEQIDFLGKGNENITNGTRPTSGSSTKSQIVNYTGVVNILQQIVFQRQIEFQNWLTNVLEIKNPTLKLMISLAIFHPSKVFQDSKYYTFKIWRIVKGFIMYLIYSFYKKSVPKKITLTLPSINEGSINHLYVAFDWYLKTNCKIKIDQDNLIVTIKKPIEGTKSDKEYPLQVGQPEEKVTEIEFKGKTISFSKKSDVETIYTPTGEVKKRNYYITLWSYECSKKSLEELCQYVANQYAKSKIEEVWVQKMFTHHNGSWSHQSMGRNRRRVSTVVLKDKVNENLLKDIHHFNETEEWHLDRGIPYKKSYLFYGPPGTGKSSMIKAISYEIKRHIHYFNLATIRDDDELSSLMNQLDFKNTIIVIEDIDAMSDISWDRKYKDELKLKELEQKDQQNNDKNKQQPDSPKDVNKKQKIGISLSGLLNQIDGIHNNHGMILVMTTNHPDKLDQALIRDGRVDDRILFGYCTHDQIYEMFKNFYNGDLTLTKSNITKINIDKYKIAPCNVENAMKKNYKDCNLAFQALLEIKEKGNIDFSDMQE